MSLMGEHFSALAEPVASSSDLGSAPRPGAMRNPGADASGRVVSGGVVGGRKDISREARMEEAARELQNAAASRLQVRRDHG